MARKPKPAPRFTALLPAQLSHVTKTKTIPQYVYLTLPEDCRSKYWRSSDGKTIYQRTDKIPPFDNPAVNALRKKLRGQRVQFIETAVDVDGVAFIHFTTTNPLT
jgi:hypothetical protein